VTGEEYAKAQEFPEKAIDRLVSRGVSLKCTMCADTPASFYTPVNAQPILTTASMNAREGEPFAECACYQFVCTHCGHIALFAKGFVDKITRESGQ
jgi:hypothetical protein